MFRRDYIIRLIEQLGAAYHTIVGLKAARRYDDAERVISRTGQQLLGFDMELLRTLTDEGLIALLRRPDAADVGAYLVAAALLAEQGEIDAIRRGRDAGYDCYLKSLSLYLEAFTLAPELETGDLAGRVAHVAGKLAGYHVPAAVQVKQFRYFEARGEYARAENVIFHLAEAGAAGVRELGAGFYVRLLGKTDEALERGGLPRAEVEDGQAAFGELTGQG